MWGLFILACLILLVLLYVPGYLLLSAFRCSRLIAFAYAPVIAVAYLAVVGTVYGKLGVAASWATTGLPFVALGALAYVAAIVVTKRSAPCGTHSAPSVSAVRAQVPGARMHLAVFVVAGVVVTAAVLLYYLQDPSSFMQRTDNTVHLNVIRAFFDSGVWSSMGASAYQLPQDAAIKPFVGSGAFYPSAWYCLCAFVMSACKVSAGMAQSVANTALIGVVFPVSLYVFVSKIFPKDKPAMLFCAITALAFAAFPWAILTFGPLFPNVGSYAVFPMVAWAVMALTDALIEHKPVLGVAVLTVIGFVALALLQPNALFFGVVFIAPYCAFQLWRMQPAQGKQLALNGHLGHVLALAFAVFVLVVWLVLYKAPFMADVVTYDSWKPARGVLGGLFDIVTVGYHTHPLQAVLAVCVLVGVVREARARERWWLLVAYAVCCVQFFACEVLTGLPRHLLCGFWYCDTYRMAANLAIVSIPLAASGLSAVYGAVCGLVEQKGAGKSATAVVAAVMVVVFMCANFAPTLRFPGGVKVHTAFGEAYWSVKKRGNPDVIKVYTKTERDFAQRAAQITGDALVINRPYDGSIYAYGDVGMRTYYRTLYRHNPKETPECVAIRTRLSSYAQDGSVKAAVHAIGAEYVLILDRKKDPDITPQPRKYDEELWTGITSVRDSTPGFEVVLKDGPMRLYRIVK